MKNFEEIISKNKSLDKLINDKEINGFCDFSKSEYDEEFKNYIQDKYYDSFKLIYHKSIETKNDLKLNALIRSVDFLATQKTKKLIFVDLIIILNNSYENLSLVKESLSDKNKLMLTGDKLDDSLSSVVINIFNKFSSNGEIYEYKIKIINLSLDICDIVSNVNPKKDPLKYAINNMIINNLEKINDFGLLKERFGKHRKNISQKRTGIEIKYWIWVVVVVMLFLLRFLSRISRN